MANPYSGATSASTALTSIRGDDDKGFAHDQVLEPSDLSTWQLIRRLMGYARPHWVSLALSFVTAAISVVLQLYVPILIGQAIDHILAVGQVDFSELLLTLRWLAVTVVGAALTQWISLYCTNRLAYETSRDLRDEAYAKFNVLSLSFIDSHLCGRRHRGLRLRDRWLAQRADGGAGAEFPLIHEPVHEALQRDLLSGDAGPSGLRLDAAPVRPP